MDDNSAVTAKCDYCGAGQESVKKLFAGETAHICDACVAACSEFLADLNALSGNVPAVPNFDRAKMLPELIRRHLDEHVVGQDEAKVILSVATYNHYKRISSPAVGDVELQKSNVMLLGPTGSGKTMLASILAKILDVPFAVGDATRVTQVGFVGPDAEDIIGRLLHAADGDPARAGRGIVYIDEIDKLAVKSGDAGAQRAHNAAAQFTFLKMMEGTVVDAPTDLSDPKKSKTVKVDTSQILFIFGGAFVGLATKEERAGLGFVAPEPGPARGGIDTKHIVDYGMIPEFIGRVPVLAELNELDESALVRILTEPKNAIVKQYQALMKMDGVDLRFTPEALSLVAREALRVGTGARGLRSIIEKVMLVPMYEAPSIGKESVLTIDAEAVRAGIARGCFPHREPVAKPCRPQSAHEPQRLLDYRES